MQSKGGVIIITFYVCKMTNKNATFTIIFDNDVTKWYTKSAFERFCCCAVIFWGYWGYIGMCNILVFVFVVVVVQAVCVLFYIHQISVLRNNN